MRMYGLCRCVIVYLVILVIQPFLVMLAQYWMTIEPVGPIYTGNFI